jgi:hypothetical protein
MLSAVDQVTQLLCLVRHVLPSPVPARWRTIVTRQCR